MSGNVTKVNNTQKGNVDVFAERLKIARLNAGYKTQKDLAKAVSVDRVTISYYEKGTRKPDIENFISIADKLNVSYDYLLGYSESAKREYHNTREITGLSDKAIDVLNYIVKDTKCELGLKEFSADKIKTINYLLENEEKYGILASITTFLWRTYETEDFFGCELATVRDDKGNEKYFSISDLQNVELIDIQRKLGNLKENMSIGK